jgi:hypothetical protein
MSCRVSCQLSVLKSVARAEPSRKEPTSAAFDDSTIQAMKEYFHVQDRDVLLKYLSDTTASAAMR